MGAFAWGIACSPASPPPSPETPTAEPAQVAPPALTTAPTADVSSTTESAAPSGVAPLPGELTADQPGVMAVRSGNAQRVMRKCFHPLFLENPRLAAGGVRVNCKVEVSPDGAVTSSEAESAAHPEVAACIQALLLTWKFPRSERGGSLTFPLIGLSAG